jgi:hypothetical protein
MVELMLRLLVMFMLLLPSSLWAATVYIDNTCANNGDGTTSSCAASGGALGALNAVPATISVTGDNSYLIKRGTTIMVAGNQVTNITGGGASDLARFTLGAYGTGARPILRANMRALLITAPAKWITIRDLEFSKMALTLDGSSAITGTHAVTQDAYITIDNVLISNITDASGGAAGQDCLTITGRHNKVLNSTITGCSQDGIQFYGDYFTATGNTISNVSKGDVFGDTIQGSTDANYFYIANNVLDHSLNAAKQTFVLADAGLQTDTGGGIFELNTLTMGDGPKVAYCIYTEQPGSTYRSNRCTQSANRSDSPGIVVTAFATGTTVAGNVVVMTAGSSNGIDAGANNSTIVNNTVIRTGARTGYGIAGGTGKTGWVAQNNIAQGFAAGIAHAVGAGYSDITNLLFGNTLACVDNTGTTRTCDASTLMVDPLFAGITDVRLKQGSPAMRAGTTNAACIDMRGNACTIPPDIGAHQMGRSEFP